MEENLKNLEKQRQELANSIDNSFLKRYEMVKTKKGLPVIAVINSDTCSSCFMVIPPRLYNEIVKGKNLTNCPHCGRFLLYIPS